MAPPTPPGGRKQRVRQSESQTHTGREQESEDGREGECISPGVEMEGTLAAVHPRQYLLKFNPLLHVCLQHRGKRQRKQSDLLTHSPETEAEADRGSENESGRNVHKQRQGRKTSELVRRPRQPENSRFKFSAFPLLCWRTLSGREQALSF